MTRSTQRSGRWSVAATVLAVSLIAAACGSDDTGSDAGASDGGNSANTAEGAPLHIGLLTNVSGEVTSGERNTPVVLEAWAEAVNAEGGVAGHPVEFVVEDTKGDPTEGTAAAQRLIDDDSIVAIVMFDSNAEGVYADAITEAGIPVIGGAGYNPEVWNALPNWLSLTTSFPSIINGNMVQARDLGAETVAYAVCAEFPTCAEIGPLAEGAADQLGLEYAGTPRLAADAPDYTADCLQAKNEGIDYLVLGHTATVGARLASDCQIQGYDGHLATNDGAVEPKVFLENDSGYTIHFVLTSFPWWVDDAPVQAYREMMESQDVPETNWADPHGTAAYATMELFQKTLDANASSLPETPTAEDIITTYGTIRNETLDGLLPQPVTFTPNEPEPVITCYWLARFEDGGFTGASLADPVCDPPELQRS